MRKGFGVLIRTRLTRETQRHQRSLQKRSDDLAEANRALPHIESPSNPRYQAVAVARRFPCRPRWSTDQIREPLPFRMPTPRFGGRGNILSPGLLKNLFSVVGFCAILGVDGNQNIPLTQFPFVLV